MEWSDAEFWFEVVKVMGLLVGFVTVIVQNNRQHTLTNSRMNELLVAKTAQAGAEGELKGIADAERAPKKLIGEIVGKVVEAGGPTKKIEGDIKGELHPKEVKVIKKTATVKKRKQ